MKNTAPFRHDSWLTLGRRQGKISELSRKKFAVSVQTGRLTLIRQPLHAASRTPMSKPSVTVI